MSKKMVIPYAIKIDPKDYPKVNFSHWVFLGDESEIYVEFDVEMERFIERLLLQNYDIKGQAMNPLAYKFSLEGAVFVKGKKFDIALAKIDNLCW